MNRRLRRLELLDTTEWPKLNTSGMIGDEKEVSERRIQAIDLYVANRSHAEIDAATGLDRTQVKRLIDNCLEIHPVDGKVWGYRAARPYTRIKVYERRASSKGIGWESNGGYAGELGRLFEQRPQIAEAVLAKVLAAGRDCNESRIRMAPLHRLFIELCKKAGIRSDAYPFTTFTQGERALSRWIKKSMRKRKLRDVVFAELGSKAAEALGESFTSPRSGADAVALAVGQFDGHHSDFYACVKLMLPGSSEPVYLLVNRLWLLVLVDEASRAILGYHVSLEKKYTAQDVLRCMRSALVPWKPRSLCIPGIAYPEGGGLPNGVIPELAYAKWGELSFDNDNSNCSDAVWTRIKKVVGCVLNPGPVRTPEARMVVERLFLTLEHYGFHRLPNTTGGNPNDSSRRTPEDTALRYRITLDEMLDLIDLVIAEYNAKPTTALFNRSPLEYLKYCVSTQSIFLKTIPESKRDKLGLNIVRKDVKVCGRLHAGENPYVNFLGAKYYSPALNESGHLIDRQMVIEVDEDDMRMARLYFKNGDEFGLLRVADSWNRPHDLQMRRAALKAKNEGRRRRRDESGDVIGDYIGVLQERAPHSKRAASQLAQALAVEKAKGGSVPGKKAGVKEVKKQLPRSGFTMKAINY